MNKIRKHLRAFEKDSQFMSGMISVKEEVEKVLQELEIKRRKNAASDDDNNTQNSNIDMIKQKIDEVVKETINESNYEGDVDWPIEVENINNLPPNSYPEPE